ncbi:MAG: flagellar biosynthetic protein FliO [Zoogloeaceae bacterium]|jgi:flagellar protein FliO/FliZ|nr:flagellar biosynthetic protein FliO [Zoogloeaceae bacterium]
MRAIPILLGVAALPGLATAAEHIQAPGVSMGNVVQAFLGLAAILLCLFLLAFLGKKFLGSAQFGQKGLKLLGGVALGPRERIVLIEAGDQWLVVGVVPGQIRTLHRMPSGTLPQDVAPETTPSLPPFADWLRRFSSRNNPSS